MNYQSVIFDLDGVIANTEDIHFLAWKNAFKDHGIFIERMDYEHHLKSRARDKGIRNIQPDIDSDVLNDIAQLKGKYFDAYIQEGMIEFFDDALELIVYLFDKGVSLGVASASTAAKTLLGVGGLQKYFKVILTGNDVKKNKPDPEIYLKASKQLKKPCLVVEDAISGIKAAVDAGLDVICIDRNQEMNYEGVEKVDSLIKLKLWFS